METNTGRQWACALRPISCDHVAWMLNAIDRYLPKDSHPRCSWQREMQKYGLLYEIMDAAGLRFEDESARLNGTPTPCRPLAPTTNGGGALGQ